MLHNHIVDLAILFFISLAIFLFDFIKLLCNNVSFSILVGRCRKTLAESKKMVMFWPSTEIIVTNKLEHKIKKKKEIIPCQLLLYTRMLKTLWIYLNKILIIFLCKQRLKICCELLQVGDGGPEKVESWR